MTKKTDAQVPSSNLRLAGAVSKLGTSPRPGSCRPWSEDSGSKVEVEVCGLPKVPNQAISFSSHGLSCVNIFQPSGPEEVEQGELDQQDQSDHHVDRGEGGDGGEGGEEPGEDAESAVGHHFFSLTKSTGLFSCCNVLFLYARWITQHFCHGVY